MTEHDWIAMQAYAEAIDEVRTKLVEAGVKLSHVDILEVYKCGRELIRRDYETYRHLAINRLAEIDKSIREKNIKVVK